MTCDTCGIPLNPDGSDDDGIEHECQIESPYGDDVEPTT